MSSEEELSDLSDVSDGSELSSVEASDGDSDMDDSGMEMGSDEFSDISVEEPKDGEEFRYEVLTPAEIMKRPLELIREVNEVLQIHPMLARQVLRHFNWNKENALAGYYDPSQQRKIFEEAKLPKPEDLEKKSEVQEEQECTICFEDCKASEVDALPCGHVFCKDCWNDYLSVKVLKEGTAQMECPAKKCHLGLDELSVSRLLQAKDARDMYTKLSAKSFVRDMKGVRWCPAKNCQYAIKAELTLPKEVECKCGAKYCFVCGLPYHHPASCDYMRRWEAKKTTEGENLAFLAKMTKNCPKCNALIWKDKGCQYMRCQQCNTGFCWLCLGLFDHKAHNCNKYDAAEKGSDRNEWNRYTHFYERWKAHSDSLKFEAKLSAKAESIIKQLTEGGMNWIDAQYIRKAVEILRNARVILATSYIMGYFLPEGTHVELFENYQGFLEEATEKLSQVLEAENNEAVNERLQVINLTENLKVRVENFVLAVEDNAFRAASGYKAEEKVFKVESEYDGWIYNAN